MYKRERKRENEKTEENEVVAAQACESGLLTNSGACCSMCPPGYGVSVPCGESDTQCEPCVANATFSSEPSATDRCQPCQVCGKGSGAQVECTPTNNSVCQLCPAGSYSEVKSSVSPCLPCRTACKESEVQIGDCTPHHDILCMDKDVPILKGDGRKDDNSTQSFIPPEDNSKNIIPVYCSILAAVVVGLIGYVAYKCYSTCKQKKLLAKARANELAALGEGEKLHSDSGVFLDTHSLQEQNQLNKAAKLEPKLYINLPPHKQEEVERLLADTSRGKDWQRLASLLAYEDDAIDAFARGEDPVHTLLTDWSSKDGSTLEVLCAALINMERPDVVENLNSVSDSSSVV
ncbi:death domain-containing membrane protein NRADD-like [Gastrophryne carolinensis]